LTNNHPIPQTPEEEESRAQTIALVKAAWSVLHTDGECTECGEEPQEGEGLCSDGCSRNALVIALRPFDPCFVGECGPCKECANYL